MNKKSPSRVARIGFPLIVVAMVCLCVAVLVPGIRRLHERRGQIEVLREDLKAARERVRQCRREIEELGTDEGIERVAREELRLAKPGETVFDFEKEPRTSGEAKPRTPSERRP